VFVYYVHFTFETVVLYAGIGQQRTDTVFAE
jgi:hypothetical protein